MQFIAVEVFNYLFTVFISNHKAYLRQGMSRKSNNSQLLQHILDHFGVLFCLLIKKVILGSKTIWQSMRKFPCAV